MAVTKKYEEVNLSINFSNVAVAIDCGGGITRCNPGGSYFCTGTSARTCPPGSCAGTSIKPPVLAAKKKQQAAAPLGMDAKMLLTKSDLQSLQAELQKLIGKYAKK